MATAKTAAKPAPKKSAPPAKAPVKAAAKKPAAKADHVIRAPSKAAVHKAGQVMAASKKATPMVKAAGRVLSAAAHKGDHTTAKEVKAIRAAEKAMVPAKKAAASAKKPTFAAGTDLTKGGKLKSPLRQQVSQLPVKKPAASKPNLVIRETPAAKADRERRASVVRNSIMAVPDERTPAKRDPNKIVEDLKAQVRQATSPAPTTEPFIKAPSFTGSAARPLGMETERPQQLDQSIDAAKPHSTPNVSAQNATKAAAGVGGAPVTLYAATHEARPDHKPGPRASATGPAVATQRTVKEFPHGMDALAAEAGTGTASTAAAPVTVPAARPAPRTQWQGASPFQSSQTFGQSSLAGGATANPSWPRSAMAGGSSAPATAQHNAAHQAQPGKIQRRFEVFNAGGLANHKWRLMDAGTGQLISVGRESFGTPGDAESNAAKEAGLYEPGTCVIVRV